MAGVYFDLGRAHQGAGDVERARSAFERVQTLDPSFPGIADTLQALAAGGAAPPVASGDEGFESFDDLMSDDDEPDDDTSGGETFESFDDLITDVEAGIEAADDAPAELTAEVELEDDDTASGTKGASRSGRKKKISFV
jgi:hypothetical protein